MVTTTFIQTSRVPTGCLLYKVRYRAAGWLLLLALSMPSLAQAQSCPAGMSFTLDWDAVSGPPSSGAESATFTIGGGDIELTFGPSACYETAMNNSSNTHGTGGNTLEWVSVTSGCTTPNEYTELLITFTHSDGVSNVSFPIIDIDWQDSTTPGSFWFDEAYVTATDGINTYTPDSPGNSYSIQDTDQVNYNSTDDYFFSPVEGNVGNTSAAGNATVTFGPGITQFRVRHRPLGRGRLGIGDITFCVNSPLPVELIVFDALVDGRDVLLAWETASETNNAGFFVERALAAHPEAFEPVGWVDGVGTTERAQSYQYRLNGLEPGRHVFRLKQIDYDGTFEYHPEVEVVVEMAETFVLEPAYPNPFNPQTQLRFGVNRTQAVQAALYDMLGRQVQTLYQGVAQEGQMHALMVDGSALPSGFYLVRIAGENFFTSQTITLLK